MKTKFSLCLAVAASFALGEVTLGQATVGAKDVGKMRTVPVEQAVLGLPEPIYVSAPEAHSSVGKSARSRTVKLQVCGATKGEVIKSGTNGPIYIETPEGVLVQKDSGATKKAGSKEYILDDTGVLIESDENGEESTEEEEGPWRMFPNDLWGFNMTGWIYGTGLGNTMNGSDTRYNGPMTQNDQTGAYLNQLWLNVNRSLEDELSWGANFDIFFGNDYLASQSRGFEARHARGLLPHWNNNRDYGFSIPQAYVEVGTTKYSVKMGHFYTPHGYMTVQAPGNFFNTLPWGFMMTNPFTHWGGLATANVTDQLSLSFGIVNGWDALSRPVNAAAYMGGVKYSFADDKGWFSCNLISGQEPENRGAGYAARTLMTNILDYNFTDRFEFVFEQNVGWQKNRGIGTDCFYNFAPYLFYKINDKWRLGLRYEFYNDPFGFTAGARVGNPNTGPYQGNFQTVAAGINWAPNGSKNLMIRPELRYDWFNGRDVGGGAPFDAGRSNDQLVLMVGAYLQY